MSEPIMVLKGRGGYVELYGDRLVAKRSGFMTFVIGKGNKEIRLGQIKSVSIRSEATAMSGGILEISTGAGVLGDYHLWYAKSQTAEVERFKSLLDERIGKQTTSTGSAPASSAADEIEKLAKLRDQAIITDAEFDAKKRA